VLVVRASKRPQTLLRNGGRQFVPTAVDCVSAGGTARECTFVYELPRRNVALGRRRGYGLLVVGPDVDLHGRPSDAPPHSIGLFVIKPVPR